MKLLSYCLLLLLFLSCKKTLPYPGPDTHAPNNEFTRYTIKTGQQYCDQNPYEATEYTTLKFIVRFDSTAIYKTIDPANQADVNKLYGFADNNSTHHHYSARFGWRWSEDKLSVFAYTYNNGRRDFQELGIIEIGKDYVCAIAIAGDNYVFSIDDTRKIMQRAANTTAAKGYKLYPYFGGDETAPHDIHIWIKELR